EGGVKPYARLLRRVATSMGAIGDLPIQVTHDLAPIGSDLFTSSLVEKIAEDRPGLIGLDPYYAYRGASGSGGSSLFEEGGVLADLYAKCRDAGADDLMINHHFNRGGGSGIKRITMAGGAEWVDSWILTSHRETPDVEAGSFKLALEVGSRQWGGASWELDLEVGRFNVEAGEHDGDIAWELRRATGVGAAAADHFAALLERVEAEPSRLTKEELAKSLGIRMEDAREAVGTAERRGLIVARLVPAAESGRRRKEWLFGPAPSTSDSRDDEDGEGLDQW
ncbi:MAG TPA: hypothetical protein VF711_02105, partial [Acidimicrobiales bacterium]